MYNHENQYRCHIIRGKSQKEMDDLLPAYALVIDEICPCEHKAFEQLFNRAFEKYLPETSRVKKTLDNHRTEISGKLFGMYYFAEDGMVYESERTQKYLADNDQPAFFKDLCYKMQFPNGTQKSNTVIERVNDQIKIRPNAFIIKFLQIAEDARVEVTKRDIGYYILNSLDVLQGIANPYEVLEQIVKDKKAGVERDIFVPDKASSYTHQHINEQLNYLELSNIIRIDSDKKVTLNSFEKEAIAVFADSYDKELEFDVYKYDLESLEGRKEFQYAWDLYYSKVSVCADKFDTSAEALVAQPDVTSEETGKSGTGTAIPVSTVEIGDEGEAIVYEYEKDRVSKYDPRLVNKVLALGKTKGLGYDIQSVIAEPGNMDEFVKYIEVKSTKRLTCPDITDDLWIDTLNLTRNEWVAAQQHKEFYSIFRVYFTRDGVFMFKLNNIAEQLQDKKMTAVPTTYRVNFGNSSVNEYVALDDYSTEVR